MKLIKMALVLALSLLFATTYANLNVSPMVINFVSKKLMRQDVRIVNLDKKTAYLNIVPMLVQRPGNKNEHRVKINNPRQLGLLVTPKKLAIPSHQTRTIRLTLLKPAIKKDIIYRISVQPVTPKLLVKKTPQGKVAAVIRVLMTYGILAIARPMNPQPNIVLARKGNKLTMTNQGNSMALLQNGKQCLAKNNCKTIPSQRLYAGNMVTLKVPYQTPVNFEAFWLGKVKAIHSN